MKKIPQEDRCFFSPQRYSGRSNDFIPINITQIHVDNFSAMEPKPLCKTLTRHENNVRL